jgi:hypothetical protein
MPLSLIEKIERLCAADLPVGDAAAALRMTVRELNAVIGRERLGLTYNGLHTHLQRRALNRLQSTCEPSQ